MKKTATFTILLLLCATFSAFSQNFKSKSIWTFDLQFDFSKSEMRPSYYPRLDSLANAMKTDSSLFINLNAYTDAVGSDLNNQELSVKRARAVLAFMTERGIKSEFFSYAGHGEVNPLADNDSEEGRQKNRRVEVVLSKRVYMSTLTGVITDQMGNKVPNAKVIMLSKNMRDSVVGSVSGDFKIEVPYQQYIKIKVSADSCTAFTTDKAFPIANFSETKNVQLRCTTPQIAVKAIPVVKMMLSGTLTNDSGKILSQTLVTFENNLKKDSVRTNDKGAYRIEIIKDEKNQARIAILGYLPFSETVLKTKTTDSVTNFQLKAIKYNEKVSLKNMSFYVGSTNLMSESVPELENLLQFMYINPTTKIEIRGHITSDSWMEPALKNSWSYELSLNRAKTVFDYLEEKGVASERMTYEGFADWEKIYKAPQSGEEHTANRRVEIKILSDAEFKKLKESRMAGRK